MVADKVRLTPSPLHPSPWPNATKNSGNGIDLDITIAIGQVKTIAPGKSRAVMCNQTAIYLDFILLCMVRWDNRAHYCPFRSQVLGYCQFLVALGHGLGQGV